MSPFDIGLEIFAYFVFAGIFTAAVVVVIAVAAAPVAWWRGAQWYSSWFARVCLLFASLYLCGLPGHLMSAAFLRGRYYIAGDPLVDFLPFLLPGDWIIDPSMNGHYIQGATAVTLYPSWALMAVPTWAVSILLYRHWAKGFRHSALAAGLSR